MTLDKVLERVKALYEPSYEDQILADWVWDTEARILQTDFLLHRSWPQYDAAKDGEVELILPPPWDELYVLALAERIHFHRGEYEDSVNCAAQYNTLHAQFLAHALDTWPLDFRGMPQLELPFLAKDGGKLELSLDIGPFQAASAVLELKGPELDETFQTEDSDSGLTLDGSHLRLTAELPELGRGCGARIYVTITDQEGESHRAEPAYLRILAQPGEE